MSVSNFLKREGSRDDGTQRSVRDAVADKALHRCELHVVAHSSSQRDATNRQVAGEDVERRNHGRIGRERAVQRQCAAVRGRFRELREAWASDRIEHEFGAAGIGPLVGELIPPPSPDCKVENEEDAPHFPSLTDRRMANLEGLCAAARRICKVI